MPDAGFPVAMPEGLTAELADGIALLRMSRPSKRNALNNAMIAGIESFFRHMPEQAKAAIVCADGDNFSAGLDLSELTGTGVTDALAHSRMWHRAFECVEFGQVPVISVLHGAVLGGGLEFAAATHIRVAEESAYFGLPEGQRGIFVGGGGSVRLPRLIGVARMMDMMLTGRVLNAQEGLAAGICQYVVPAGHGLERARSLAAGIASNAPLTNFALMQALPRIAAADRETGLLLESLMAAVAQSDSEAKRRLRDFLDKRAARVTPD